MNQSEPLVSVIIPNYNHSRYLKQRIDSVLNQSFQDFELIILDDCSTDNSRTVIEEYTSSNKVSHIIFNEQNSGSTFIQWQKGFSLAKGKYIWIAESDDYADLTFLEKLVSLMERYPRSSLAFSLSTLIDNEGNLLDEDWDRSRYFKSDFSIFEGFDFAKSFMLFNNNIYNASMAIFRKSLLNFVETDYVNFKYSGDWLFWNNMCLYGEVIRCNNKLNYFRQYPHKVTSKADFDGLGFLESKFVIQKLMNDLNLNFLQKKVVVGWFLKRILSCRTYKSDIVKKTVFEDAKSFFYMGKNSILIYKLDKRLNFSSLNLRKSRQR